MSAVHPVAKWAGTPACANLAEAGNPGAMGPRVPGRSRSPARRGCGRRARPRRGARLRTLPAGGSDTPPAGGAGTDGEAASAWRARAAAAPPALGQARVPMPFKMDRRSPHAGFEHRRARHARADTRPFDGWRAPRGALPPCVRATHRAARRWSESGAGRRRRWVSPVRRRTHRQAGRPRSRVQDASKGPTPIRAIRWDAAWRAPSRRVRQGRAPGDAPEERSGAPRGGKGVRTGPSVGPDGLGPTGPGAGRGVDQHPRG